MVKVKALIVDDSVVYRTQIRAALQLFPWVEVVATSSNGYSAVDRAASQRPDVIILDLEMPGIDGIQTLEQLKNLDFKPKVIIFSSISKRGAKITLDALDAGACDFIPKPDGDLDARGLTGLTPAEKIRDLLKPKLNALFPKHVEANMAKGNEKGVRRKENSAFPKVIWDLFNPEILVIGSSTGGPTALEKIFIDLGGLPLKCPVVIVQHMPPIFTATFADRLAKFSGQPVVEAKEGELLESGRVYIAPGDFHLRLKKSEDSVFVSLDQGPQVNSVRPAVDLLFNSAAEIYGARCLGIVLTGMGADGRAGSECIKGAGGAVVIQDEASSVVFGMPGAVFATGAYDKMGNLDAIVDWLKDKVVARPITRRASKAEGE